MGKKQKKQEKRNYEDVGSGLFMASNISCGALSGGRLPIPIPEEDFGNFTNYNPLDQPYKSICYDCKNHKLGNILRDSNTKKLIFICGDCFEIRIERKGK